MFRPLSSVAHECDVKYRTLKKAADADMERQGDASWARRDGKAFLVDERHAGFVAWLLAHRTRPRQGPRVVAVTNRQRYNQDYYQRRKAAQKTSFADSAEKAEIGQ